MYKTILYFHGETWCTKIFYIFHAEMWNTKRLCSRREKWNTFFCVENRETQKIFHIFMETREIQKDYVLVDNREIQKIFYIFMERCEIQKDFMFSRRIVKYKKIFIYSRRDLKYQKILYFHLENSRVCIRCTGTLVLYIVFHSLV